MTERRVFPPAPTARRALLLTGHPDPDSFNHALAKAWTEGAESEGLTVEHLDVHSLDFDPCLRVAHRSDQPLEPDLIRVKEALTHAAHVAVVTPVWWGSLPAALKGVLDRVLLPGWAFAYDENHWPVQGLKGRSGRVILTMDAPVWYDALLYRGAARAQLGPATMGFCGIKPVRTRAFGSLVTSTEAHRKTMLAKARQDGVADGLAVARRLPAAPAELVAAK